MEQYVGLDVSQEQTSVLIASVVVVEFRGGQEVVIGRVRYGGIAKPTSQHRGPDDRGENGACRAAAEERRC